MSPADQRHSVGVLHTVRSVAPDAPDWVCQAAILHDVGKVESNLGVVGRTAATVARPLRRRVAMPSAFATYWDHPRRGHDLILGSGGDGRVATWAAEHHRDPDQWTLPQNWALVLKQSDDD